MTQIKTTGLFESGPTEKYYGQHGQDSIIKQFFSAKGIDKGVFVDVGASDGKRFSNTLLLENSGWKGICVEAHPSYFNLLKENRPNSICYSAAAGGEDKVKTPISLNYRASLTTLDLSLEDYYGKAYKTWYGDRDKKEVNGFLNGVHEVEMRTIDSMIQENIKTLPKVNVLCIDIDGSEKYAFEGLTLNSWNPDMLVLEHEIIGDNISDSYAFESGYVVGRRMGSDTLYLKSKEDINLLNNLRIEGEIDQESTIHPAGGPL